MWNLSREEQLVLLFLIGAFTIGLGIRLLGGIPQKPSSSPPALIKVKIYGAVKKPGWHRISQGSTTEKLIEKAGGILPWADLSEVELSRPLVQGVTIYIPEGKMNLNFASAKELTFLPGIGPELAKRIINYRTRKGGFKTLSELKEVPGIGEVRFQKIKDKLMIEKQGGKSE